MKDSAILVLEALGHIKSEHWRCTARYRDKYSTVPGPPALPVWCDLNKGHNGPHKHVAGHHVGIMRDDLIEMVPLPEVCRKCRTPWPCDDAKKVIAVFE